MSFKLMVKDTNFSIRCNYDFLLFLHHENFCQKYCDNCHFFDALSLRQRRHS